MSDFNSKILVAEAFGIVTSPLAAELHVMRNIRNAFAHAKTIISFNDTPVKNKVGSMKLIEAMRSFKLSVKNGDRVTLTLPPKGLFLFATRITLIMLHTLSKFKSPADKVIRRALEKKPATHR